MSADSDNPLGDLALIDVDNDGLCTLHSKEGRPVVVDAGHVGRLYDLYNALAQKDFQRGGYVEALQKEADALTDEWPCPTHH